MFYLECAVGYIPETGDIPGDGLEPGFDSSLQRCADECTEKNECKSFSFSKSRNECKLMKDYYPTDEDPFQDFQFCRKNDGIGN